MRRARAAVTVAAALLCHTAAATSQVLRLAGSRAVGPGWVESAPNRIWGVMRAEVSGQVRALSSESLCAPVRDRCDGGVALARGAGDGCSFETKARHAKAAGCAGLIVETDYAEAGGSICGPLQFDGTDTRDIADLAMVSVVLPVWLALRADVAGGLVVNATLSYGPRDYEANGWYRVWHSRAFRLGVRLGLPVAQGAALLAMVFQYRRFTRLLLASYRDSAPRKRRSATSPSRRLLRSLPVVIMSLEIGNSMVRFVYFVLDPLWSEHVLSRMPAQVMLTITQPMSLITTLLLAIFWARAVRLSRLRGERNYKLVVLVGGAVVYGLDVGQAVARGLFYSTFALIAATGLIYVSLNLVVGGMYVYHGGRVLRLLRARLRQLEEQKEVVRRGTFSEASVAAGAAPGSFSSVGALAASGIAGSVPEIQHGQQITRLMQMSRMVVTNAVCMILTAICGLSVAAGALGVPHGSAAVFSVALYVGILQSLARVWTFPPPAATIAVPAVRAPPGTLAAEPGVSMAPVSAELSRDDSQRDERSAGGLLRARTDADTGSSAAGSLTPSAIAEDGRMSLASPVEKANPLARVLDGQSFG